MHSLKPGDSSDYFHSDFDFRDACLRFPKFTYWYTLDWLALLPYDYLGHCRPYGYDSEGTDLISGAKSSNWEPEQYDYTYCYVLVPYCKVEY
jgi:hypothetical protein